MNHQQQARALVMTALRIVRDVQVSHSIPTSSVLMALSRMYRDSGYFDSAQWTSYAARQIRSEESRGGR